MFKINFKQSLTNSLLIQSSAILYITGNCSTAKAFSSNFVTVDLNNIVLPNTHYQDGSAIFVHNVVCHPVYFTYSTCQNTAD